MPRITPLRRWLALLALLAAVLVAAFLWYRPLLNVGSGYAAKHACSCHFLQGRALDDISAQDLNFSVLGWFSLERDSQAVVASLAGLVPRRAVYRPGFGCTLVQDGALPLGGAAAPPARSTPGPAPAAPPDPTPELAAALDYGMQPVPGGGARGLVVLQDGRLLGERYAPGFDATTPLLGWSMTKTVTALALGAHFRRNLRYDSAGHAVNRSRLFPEWTDERAAVTLADLLRMNSGLAWNEGYGSLTDATIMLHEQPDFAAYAAAMPTAWPPGRVWNYSSGTTNLLMQWLENEFGNPAARDYFLYHSFLGRIAPSLLIEPDQSGTPVGSSYGWATARDWANLGQFMLQDGVWAGDTLVNPDWIAWLRRPAPHSDGTYGGQLWLPGPRPAVLPPDAYVMRGFQDQRVFVVPSRRLVVARLGHGEDKVTDFDELLRRILTALP